MSLDAREAAGGSVGTDNGDGGATGGDARFARRVPRLDLLVGLILAHLGRDRAQHACRQQGVLGEGGVGAQPRPGGGG